MANEKMKLAALRLTIFSGTIMTAWLIAHIVDLPMALWPGLLVGVLLTCWFIRQALSTSKKT